MPSRTKSEGLLDEICRREAMLDRARLRVMELADEVEELIRAQENYCLAAGMVVVRLKRDGTSPVSDFPKYLRTLIRRQWISPGSPNTFCDNHFDRQWFHPSTDSITTDVSLKLKALEDSGRLQTPEAIFAMPNFWNCLTDEFVVFRGRKYSVAKLRGGK